MKRICMTLPSAIASRASTAENEMNRARVSSSEIGQKRNLKLFLLGIRMHFSELNVRTQYDGKDYLSVEEIYFVDEDCVDRICESATAACMDISTCADQGVDLWSWLREQVEIRLHALGITYDALSFDDE